MTGDKKVVCFNHLELEMRNKETLSSALLSLIPSSIQPLRISLLLLIRNHESNQRQRVMMIIGLIRSQHSPSSADSDSEFLSLFLELSDTSTHSIIINLFFLESLVDFFPKSLSHSHAYCYLSIVCDVNVFFVPQKREKSLSIF